jgi:sugar phosphate isomerase/epimerase
LLSSTFYGFDPLTVLRRLSSQIVQFHLADAKGFDGEGFQIGEGEVKNLELFNEVFKFPQRKVLEPWQGHLNLYSGFYAAVEKVGNFYDNK